MSASMTHIRWIWLGVIFHAAAVNAAGHDVNQIKIQFTGDCKPQAPVTVILNNDEDQPLRAFRQMLDKEGEYWFASVNPARPFDSETSHITVRFKGGRTECRRTTKFAPDIPSNWVANFSFSSCGDDTIVDVTVKTDPGVDVKYFRDLPSRNPTTIPPCNGHATYFGNVDKKIESFWPRPETLTLHLYGSELVVNSVLARVKENRKRIVNGRELDLNGITFEWTLRRVQGNGKGLDLSPNAIEIDVKKLKNAHFNYLKLAVEK
jgi:hypothetical protein